MSPSPWSSPISPGSQDARAYSNIAPPLPLPIERVPRALRPPSEYSPHREFTVLVSGAGMEGPRASRLSEVESSQ
ncbi:hypothetical protein K523DRAFT_358893 [Schizophyllum commune Tattone D]|nr:hypothetical protein K523DRAFT_358893 [Schizophyllum commune Tattone D]